MIFFSGIVILYSNIIAAQETPLPVTMEARLETIMSLNIEPETYCEFSIKRINDNLYQITNPPEDVMFSVESTGNWDLSISAADSYFTGKNDTNSKIPLDFVGYFIENKGSNWDNGLFSNIANVTKDTIVYLSPEKTRVLENGIRNNVGSASHNSFILRWKFFYEEDAMRTRRFADFDIADDEYTVGFYITLSESSAKGRRE